MRQAPLPLEAVLALLCTLPALGAEPPDLVEVTEGLLRGRCDAYGICSFLGVPYAAPPTGDLRWRPPQTPWRWQGVREATEFGAKCLQVNTTTTVVDGDESCLFLNVWTPAGNCSRGAACAVMFWIHGGSYTTGSGAQMYNGEWLVDLARNVVVVTINYRLGILGFAGSHELRGRDAAGSTGNYGLQDQRFAMAWVQRNIHRFGGDNNNVMIFGESAGGGSVSAHLVMPSSWPLYHKAVVESGSFSYWSAQPMWEASQQYDGLAWATGCAGMDRLKCLLAMGGRKLVNISTLGLMPVEHPYGCAFGPTVDEVELKRLPWELLQLGMFNKDVPIMLGYNKDEGTLGVAENVTPGWEIFSKGHNMTKDDFKRVLAESAFRLSPGQVEEALELYGGQKTWYWAATHFEGDYHFSCPTRRTARILNNASSHKVFHYLFNYVPSAIPVDYAGLPGVNGTAGSFHSAELEFVWQSIRSSRAWPSLLGSSELLLARTMVAYWVNFAVHSDPNIPAGRTDTELTIQWPSFAWHEASLQLDLPRLSVGYSLLRRQCDFMDSLGVLVQPVPKKQWQQRRVHQRPQQSILV